MDTTRNDSTPWGSLEIAERLQAWGIRAVLDHEGVVWIGRLRLEPDGRATAGGQLTADLGPALWALARALPTTNGSPPLARPGPKPKRGREARAAEADLLRFAELEKVEIQRLGPGRWVVGRRALYSTSSGRVRALPHGRALPRRGLDVLRELLAETAPRPHPKKQGAGAES